MVKPGISNIYKRTYTTLIKNFTSKEVGSGNGPFIQLPKLTSYHNMILLNIPSFTTIYGNLRNISMLDISKKDMPGLYLSNLKDSNLTEFHTNNNPVNLILSLTNNKESLKVINLDTSSNGLVVPDLKNSVIYYSGDLTLNHDIKKITGFGVLVIKGSDNIFAKTLKEDESITIRAECVLAYDDTLTLQINDKPKVSLREQIFKKGYFFGNKNEFIKASGPGNIYLQNSI
ncbi:hypothetical protein TBLA_0C03380 [Henningerozyma blattae CBS 6284]|uniref:Altered inheritance of mitochondria protein 24, mitochondrial n=1 Tax=Henningerozyma blattae (strain ATCC 34711 / CBS 6284 / DSM 70876 / NBRC 10599 / NRRL Y-10934 / UCD 77-7) TaxID=1071380 RepID=I2H189_HENB6|nr:hypothetical protein TBLA_0C03380 [Tetrapisispora blattae CBS 6284]CCH60141.1 hypothetical protein TBLA_0C03380 [Tetrapisispora blattae CBS 6284]